MNASTKGPDVDRRKRGRGLSAGACAACAALAATAAVAACGDDDSAGDGAAGAGVNGRGGATAAGGPAGDRTGGSAGSAGGDAAAGRAGGAGAAGAPGGDEARLVVADTEAARLYVYGVPGNELRAQFDGVKMSEHAGFLQLGGGRVAYVDEAAKELVVLQVYGGERPAEVRRTPVEGAAVHIATDPAHAFVAVSATVDDDAAGAAGAGGATPKGRMTVVKLDDFSRTVMPIDTGEPGVLLGGSPLKLFHRNDAPPRLEAYALDAVLAGAPALLATAPLGGGPHGELMAHGLGKIAVATDGGITIVPVTDGGFGAPTTAAYDVGADVGGRAYYARLSADGRYLYSYLRNSGAPNTTWSGWKNDVYVVDLETGAPKRIAVGNGLVYRLADSRRYALYAHYSPDGDAAVLLDADASSPAFQTIVARVPLAPLSKAPAPDGDVWSSVAFRIVGMSPDGTWGFVTHGGDGAISVIDTARRGVVATIETPTPLDYGGYLTVLAPAMAPGDTVGR
jgi:hypothetical protein